MWKHFLLAILLMLPFAAAPDEVVNVTLDENGKITNYYNTYWVVNVNGTGVINNPSSRDLFDVRLQFDLLTLELIPGDGDGEFEANSIKWDRIPAQGSQTFSYQIVGIAAQPPTLTDKGVLYTGLAKRTPRIYSDLFGELQKAPLEDPAITNRDARLISVTLDNPTELPFTVQSMRVIKTPQLDPNNILDTWNIINDSAPIELEGEGFFVYDFIDANATEGEVYWLQSDVFISRVELTDINTIRRFTEENLSEPIELLNYTNTSDNTTSRLITSSYLLRKEVSDTLALPGEPLTVKLTLYNLDERLRQYTITDYLPYGFTADKELQFAGQVPRRGSVVHRYRVVLNESSFGGVDAFPSARAEIGGQTVFSPKVTFLRQYSPDNRVYLQKRIRYRDEDTAEVTLQVQNLGQVPIEGVTLREFLNDDDVFSEITYQPQSKGLWELPRIGAGETWTVSYVTGQGDTLTTLPTLYGVPANALLRSIILENVVEEGWAFVRTRWIEFIGIAVLVLVPLALFFGRREN